MKSKATKDKVREELAKSIAEQIGDSLKEISDKTAERVVEIWLEFRRAHAKVVELADRQDGFKRFLDTRQGRRPAAARRDRRPGAGERGRGRRDASGSTTARCIAPVTGAAAGGPRHRPRGALAGDGAASGRPSPATACPRSSSTRSTAARKPDDVHQGRACSACSACRTGSPITRLAVAAAGGARRRCSSSRHGELKKLARTLDETQLDSLVALSDRARQGVRPARAARGGAVARRAWPSWRAAACARRSSPAATRPRPSA